MCTAHITVWAYTAARERKCKSTRLTVVFGRNIRSVRVPQGLKGTKIPRAGL